LPEELAPAVGANLTGVAWRPDGGDPTERAMDRNSQGPGLAVKYRLTWVPVAGTQDGWSRTDPHSPVVEATYIFETPEGEVAEDARRLSVRLGVDDAWVEAFLQSATPGGFGPTPWPGPDGTDATPERAPPTQEHYRTDWTEEAPLPPVPMQSRHLVAGSTAWYASLPLTVFSHNGANFTFRAELTSDEQVSIVVDGADPFAIDPAEELALWGIHVEQLRRASSQVSPSYWCDPRDGSRWDLPERPLPADQEAP
jgi:hypothetical protein